MVGSYPKLNRCREVVKIGIKLLLQGLTALLVRNEVYEGRCNDALLALDGLDDLLGESARVSIYTYRGCGSRTGNRRRPWKG